MKIRFALAFTTLLAGCTNDPTPRAIPDVSPDAPTVTLWSEHFDRPPLDWIDPEDHAKTLLAQVYGVQTEGTLSFLHARHDGAASGAPPAMHYGHSFDKDAIDLDRIRALKFRWRAVTHPKVTDDPWLDLAVGIYVVIKTPGVLGGGKGFKFGWSAKPAPIGTYQLGLLQIPLRSDPVGTDWRTESVDLCALYRNEYGSCSGEKVLYIGVTTDGDGTKSLAQGDYADFEILGVSP